MTSLLRLLVGIHVTIQCMASDWIFLPSIPRSSAGWAVGSYDRTIYLLGGVQNNRGFLSYSVDSPQFTILQSPISEYPVYSASQFSTQQGNILYFFKDSTSLSAFDLSTQQYSSVSFVDLTRNVGLSCLASSDEYLFVVGGREVGTIIDTLQMLQISTQQWVANAPRMQAPRAYHACTTHGDYLFALTGFDGNEYVATTERLYTPYLWQYGVGSWEDSVSLSLAVIYARAVSYGNRIFIIGGTMEGGNKQSTVQIMDTASGTVSLETMPEELDSMGAICFEQDIYVFGGRTSGGTSNKALYYNLITGDPTYRPSEPPTAPTDAPSRAPTDDPTKGPSSAPIPPSVSPIPAPSKHPTIAPSRGPTQPPINVPTKSPTSAPSLVTVSPTRFPSVVPSHTPSNVPSHTPSDGPMIRVETTEESEDKSGAVSGKGDSDKMTLTIVLSIVSVLLLTILAVLLCYDWKNKRTQNIQDSLASVEKKQEEQMHEPGGDAKNVAPVHDNDNDNDNDKGPGAAKEEDGVLEGPGAAEEEDVVLEDPGAAEPNEEDILAQVLALSLAEEEERKQEQIAMMQRFSAKQNPKDMNDANDDGTSEAESAHDSDDDVLKTDKITTAGNDEIVDEYKQDVQDVMDNPASPNYDNRDEVALNTGTIQSGIGLALSDTDSDDDVLAGAGITMGAASVNRDEAMFDADLPESDNSDDDVLIGANIGVTTGGGQALPMSAVTNTGVTTGGGQALPMSTVTNTGHSGE